MSALIAERDAALISLQALGDTDELQRRLTEALNESTLLKEQHSSLAAQQSTSSEEVNVLRQSLADNLAETDNVRNELQDVKAQRWFFYFYLRKLLRYAGYLL